MLQCAIRIKMVHAHLCTLASYIVTGRAHDLTLLLHKTQISYSAQISDLYGIKFEIMQLLFG